MPRFRSENGKWYPVKEYHINAQAKPGENPVYEGPDRAAVEMLQEKGVEFLGYDCAMEEETMVKARQLGCNSVEEYLKKYKGIDLEKNKELHKEKLEKEIHLDEEVFKPKQPFVPERSGGDDTSGKGKSIKGGFGDPQGVSLADLSQRAK